MATRKTRSDKVIFTPAMISQVEVMAGYGMSIQKIAAVLGFKRNVIDKNKSDKTSELAEAIARGRAVAQRNVAASLYENAVGGDFQSQKWIEISRFGFVDASRTDIKQETTMKIRVVPHVD